MEIHERLRRLAARRRGLDRVLELSEPARHEVFAKIRLEESWQRRAPAQPITRYVLGAMQEIDPDSTRISMETARRVGKHLKAGLEVAGLAADLELQGSVPLNVHIRGVSDVDLWALKRSVPACHPSGETPPRRDYPPSAEDPLTALLQLRSAAEEILEQAFPAAKIDKSGFKAIAVSGGSLARKVEVMSAHWSDTVGYQRSGLKEDRAVVILDTYGPSTVESLPFLHVKRIGDRCLRTRGGLRKAIRLCKTVKTDVIEEGIDVPLSSLDVAAVMFHASELALRAGVDRELAILAQTQRHLRELANDHGRARRLLVPDGSRFIFDAERKLLGLDRLAEEFDELVSQVAVEQNQAIARLFPCLDTSRRLIETAYLS